MNNHVDRPGFIIRLPSAHVVRSPAMIAGRSSAQQERCIDTMESNPILPRRRLGMELRRLRELAGISTEEAAGALECSQSKISRLETGKGVPRTRDVRDLIALYGAPAESGSSELLRLAKDGQNTQAWWNSFRDVVQGDLLPDHLLRFVALEQDSATILNCSPMLIPGLLQTEGYVRAIADVLGPTVDARDRDRFIQFRVKRQQVLHREPAPLEFKVLLCESVALRRTIPAQTIIDQLLYLIKIVGDPRTRVEVKIVPLDAGFHRGLTGPFSVIHFADGADQDVVYLEGAEGAVYLENPDIIKRYRKTFQAVESRALSVQETKVRLMRIIEEHRRAGSQL